MSETTTSDTLGSRLRNNLALAQTRLGAAEARARAHWVGLPQQLRAALDRLAHRLRDGLDIPSRSELTELIERIEQVDAKLADLEARQKAAKEASKPASAPAPAKAKASEAAPAPKARAGGEGAEARSRNSAPKKPSRRKKSNRKKTGDAES